MSHPPSTFGRPQFHSVLIMTKNEGFVAAINSQAGAGGGGGKKKTSTRERQKKKGHMITLIYIPNTTAITALIRRQPMFFLTQTGTSQSSKRATVPF